MHIPGLILVVHRVISTTHVGMAPHKESSVRVVISEWEGRDGVAARTAVGVGFRTLGAGYDKGFCRGKTCSLIMDEIRVGMGMINV